MDKNYLVLIRERAEKRGSCWLYEYKCICGKLVMVPPYKIKSNKTKSCGCKSNEFISAKNSTHNLSKHPLFSIWAGIIARCYSEGATKYKDYGAKGIRMCDLWKNNFKEFYDWAIANKWQKGLQIDKDIVPSKLGIPALLYSPELCSIVTTKQNCNKRSTNRVFEYEGEKKTISEWADSIGIHQTLMRYRIEKWGIEKALKKPVGKGSSTRIICETTGEVFESIISAVREKDLTKKNIYKVLIGKKKETKGLSFKYLN